jgi:hypothetical protein
MENRKGVSIAGAGVATPLYASHWFLYFPGSSFLTPLLLAIRFPASDLALSSCSVSSTGQSVIIGSWDNHIYHYSIDYGRTLQKLHAHDDAVRSYLLH